ncbi:hypothetical protein ACNKHT_14265 [Shigella flexneri]
MALYRGLVLSDYQTGNYQQVKIWQQATAQAPALLDRALDPKADPGQRRRHVASCAGDAYSTAKKSGRYRRLDYVGPRRHGAG